MTITADRKAVIKRLLAGPSFRLNQADWQAIGVELLEEIMDGHPDTTAVTDLTRLHARVKELEAERDTLQTVAEAACEELQGIGRAIGHETKPTHVTAEEVARVVAERDAARAEANNMRQAQVLNDEQLTAWEPVVEAAKVWDLDRGYHATRFAGSLQLREALDALKDSETGESDAPAAESKSGDHNKPAPTVPEKGDAGAGASANTHHPGSENGARIHILPAAESEAATERACNLANVAELTRADGIIGELRADLARLRAQQQPEPQPSVRNHYFMPDPEHRDQCRVHVPVLEAGKTVGTCCGYPEKAHEPQPAPTAEVPKWYEWLACFLTMEESKGGDTGEMAHEILKRLPEWPDIATAPQPALLLADGGDTEVLREWVRHLNLLPQSLPRPSTLARAHVVPLEVGAELVRVSKRMRSWIDARCHKPLPKFGLSKALAALPPELQKLGELGGGDDG